MALVWNCPSCPGTVLVGAGECRDCGSLVRVPIARRAVVVGHRRRRLVSIAALMTLVGIVGTFGPDASRGTGQPAGSGCSSPALGTPPLLDEFELLQASAGVVGRLAITADC